MPKYLILLIIVPENIHITEIRLKKEKKKEKRTNIFDFSSSVFASMLANTNKPVVLEEFNFSCLSHNKHLNNSLACLYV